MMMNEQQKARIVELAKMSEYSLIAASVTGGKTVSKKWMKSAEQSSAEAFRIAQEGRS